VSTIVVVDASTKLKNKNYNVLAAAIVIFKYFILLREMIFVHLKSGQLSQSHSHNILTLSLLVSLYFFVAKETRELSQKFVNFGCSNNIAL
jgi:hypothetical protein